MSGSATSVPATSGPANSPLANSRLAKAAPSESGRDEAGSADREPARIVPPRSHDQVPAPAKAGNRSGVFAEWQPSAVAIPPSPCEHDEGTLEDHIAAFEAALADVMETLAETQAYDTAKANAAGGD